MSTSISVRIDLALDKYYKRNGFYNYINPNTGIGKFVDFLLEENYEEDILEDEIGPEADIEDCGLLDFDENFPLPKNTDRQKEIFRILQNCYKYGTADPHSKKYSKPNATKPKIKKQTTTKFNQEMNSSMVLSWLESLTPTQAQYLQLFIKHKYDSVDKIAHINSKQTLQQIGITLPGHKTKLWKGIKELKKSRGLPVPESPYEDIKTSFKDEDSSDDDNKSQTPSTPLKPLRFTPIKNYVNPQCDSEDIQICDHIKRLMTRYIKYEYWNQNGEKKHGDELWEELSSFLDKSNSIYLMDDYHHYRDRHSQSQQISQLKSYIIKIIHIKDCMKQHDLENHHIAEIDPKTVKLERSQIMKLQIFDNIHLEWMHNVDDINNYNTPRGTAGGTTGGALSPLSPPIIQTTPMIQTTPKSPSYNYGPTSSYTKMTPVDEGAEDESLIMDKMPAIMKKTKGNQSHLDQFHNNKVFSKHLQQCHKFVSSINASYVNIPKINQMSYATQSISQYSDDEFDSDSDDDQKDEDDSFHDDIPSYSFGRRWFYWEYYKTLEPAKYVEKRYKTLKQEVLNNTIYSLTIIDWDSVNKKATEFMRCSKAKQLKASGVLKDHYLDEYDVGAIEVNHIIALLFYCNYDNLQSALSGTFRILECDARKGEDEDQELRVWDKVRKRNTQYANWSRLLREAVELFGIQFRDNRNIKLYHGIDCELVFDSINCRFCAPTSMTTQSAVAESFSQGNGLILQLVIYDLDLRFFDVSWLSNYPTESERLFIGGHQSIRINSITMQRMGENYKHYMMAIGIIQNMFDARHNPINVDKKLNNKTINAINNLLFIKYKGSNNKLMIENEPSFAKSPSLNPYKVRSYNKKSSVPTTQLLAASSINRSKTKSNVLDFDIVVKIPSYIRTLFHHFCRKWDKQITIDIAKFNKSNEYKQFKQSLTQTMIEDDNSWVALDLICSIFENVLCIHIVNGFKFKQQTFKKLYELLKQNENVFKNLNEIKVEISGYMNSVENLLQISENVHKMKGRFAEINWRIGIIEPQQNEEEDEKKDTLNEDIDARIARYIMLVKGGNQTTGGYTPGDQD